MGAEAPHTVAFSIRGPIVRADLDGLTARVCGLLREAGAGGVAVCEVEDVEPDAVTVDALCRLQLGEEAFRTWGVPEDQWTFTVGAMRLRSCSSSSSSWG